MFQSNLSQRLNGYVESLAQSPGYSLSGRLTRLVGLTLEASGVNAAVGTRCQVETPDGHYVPAEVVGFEGERTYLMCIGNTQGLAPGARIISTGQSSQITVSHQMLGRIINGSGEPIDGKGPISNGIHKTLNAHPINPLTRAPITEPLDVGVQAINALLSVGKGQRLGLFAGSGVGKSMLLGMMTRFTTADVVVVGLIGERGREVKEFIDQALGPEALARAVVVAAPADETALMRLQGAVTATAIAEYFRDQGLHVLLLMDSLTRYAQAQREIGLAVGEPPATKGYPPSVFTKLPQLVERAGNAEVGRGGITAVYTVLTEGDDQQDPIADAARAILDGHIVLSRRLAEQGHYPAIDIEASISRVMVNVVPQDHIKLAQSFKQYYSLYQQQRDLILLGAYKSGSDPEVDKAIRLQTKLNQFLQQDFLTSASFLQSKINLKQLFVE